jgi:hypothetical protein
VKRTLIALNSNANDNEFFKKKLFSQEKQKVDERLLRLLLRQWAELLLCQRLSANDQNLLNGPRRQKEEQSDAETRPSAGE